MGGCVSTHLTTPQTLTAQRHIATSPNATVKIGKPYQVFGVWYVPIDDTRYDATGVASWYGPGFHSLNTANGERYEMDGISAAHKTLPLPSYVEVHNLDNGRKLVVRVNDRGPFVVGRIIDLSRAAAQLLGVDRPGTAKVRVRRVYPDAAQIARLQPKAIAAPPIAIATQAEGAVVPVMPSDSHVGVQASPAAPPIAKNGASFVQVAALSDAGRAAWLSAYIKSFGPVVTERSPSGYWRVRLGPYANLAIAQQSLAQVQAAGYGDAQIINVAPTP